MSIFEKINKVMSDVQYLTKDDNVSTGGNGSYKAISEEKVTSTIRESLIKNGIVIIPIKQEHKREDEKVIDKYGNEKMNRLTTVNVTYRIQSIEDKEDYIEAVSSGTGVDTQDKGIGKAMTYAYKYLLLRTFAIPTGEDPDKISSDIYSEQFNTQKEEIKLITQQNVIVLQGLIKTLPEAKPFYDNILTTYRVNDLSRLNTKQYAEILVEIKKLKGE